MPLYLAFLNQNKHVYLTEIKEVTLSQIHYSYLKELRESLE